MMINALTDNYTRQHFSDVMHRVNDEHAPVMDETAYVLRNPAGGARLMEAVEELRQGGGRFRELDESAG